MASATERMIAYHLSRLKDKRAEVRREAIQELALLKAVEAYDTLEDMFHNDPDEVVQKTAQRAGLLLYKLKQTQAKPDTPDGNGNGGIPGA
ncbi:MAG: HEAT repeat domain-containing protein [Anaerolineae bacterium]|nr:HEAT repeat domain-containing protein [Anaerolineae bacterium]